jgi:hypothetical protein
MKKIIVIFVLLNFFSSYSYSQLEVNDTLLMAFTNGIFWDSSSELEMGSYADYGKYGSTNLGDSNPKTCWAEGSESDGIGEYILMTIPENITSLKIRNGYQKDESIYNANNRPKKLELTLYATYEPSGYVTETHNGFFISEPLSTTKIEVADKFGLQEINTGFKWPEIYEELSHDNTFEKDRFILKITILDVYKGEKWNDACISDINIVPSPYYNLTNDEQGFIKVIDYKSDTLFYDSESIYSILEISPDAQWIIFIEMPAFIENSRVETTYKLFNITNEKFIELNDLFEMYGFTEKEGKTYIEGVNKDFEDELLLLEDLK